MSVYCSAWTSLISLRFMPPGIPHEVLTTDDSVTVGGHFLVPELLVDTVAASLKVGTFRPWANAPINASHNSATRCMVDRAFVAALKPAEDELWELQRTGKCLVDDEICPIKPLLVSFKFINLAMAVLLGDLAFTQKHDDMSDCMHHEYDQHGATLKWLGLLLMWCQLKGERTFIEELEEKALSTLKLAAPDHDDRRKYAILEVLEFMEYGTT